MKKISATIAVLVLASMPFARADHIESVVGPGEPARSFPADFDLSTLPDDSQAQAAATGPFWSSKKIGGWGGMQAGDPTDLDQCGEFPVGGRGDAVILVHGTTEDASFWRANPSGEGTITNVRAQLIGAGWCPTRIWAISYTGAKGYFTANDINTDDLYGFYKAVTDYLTAKGIAGDRVHIVAHSLGVTVARRTFQLHPDMAERVLSFVALAGANHGTTACRGVGTLHGSHVCEELEPGSAWLAQLNGPAGEHEDLIPRTLTMYSSGPSADQFYLGPDEESPALNGACNISVGPVAHNTIARGDLQVRYWIRYLLINPGVCETYPQV